MLNQKNQKTPKKQLSAYARFSSIAFQMIVIIGVGTYVGVTLDEMYTNQYNLYTLIFSLGSVIVSMVYVIRRIITASKDND